jgi:hypothetical protein
MALAHALNISVSGLARDAEVQMQLAARMREVRRELGLIS